MKIPLYVTSGTVRCLLGIKNKCQQIMKAHIKMLSSLIFLFVKCILAKEAPGQNIVLFKSPLFSSIIR